MVYLVQQNQLQSVLSCPATVSHPYPTPVWMLCHDLAIVGTTGTIAFGAHWSQQVIGFHEPQYRSCQTHALGAIERGLSCVLHCGTDWLPESSRIASTSSSSLMTVGSGALLGLVSPTARVPRQHDNPAIYNTCAPDRTFPSLTIVSLSSWIRTSASRSRMNWSFFSCNSNISACCPIFFSMPRTFFTSSRLLPF